MSSCSVIYTFLFFFLIYPIHVPKSCNLACELAAKTSKTDQVLSIRGSITANHYYNQTSRPAIKDHKAYTKIEFLAKN